MSQYGLEGFTVVKHLLADSTNPTSDSCLHSGRESRALRTMKSG